MTTIIIIVVVALVFFVTICVVTFMVWKRETEMRTDSIKAIENNLEEVLYELSNESSAGLRERRKTMDDEEEHHELQKPDDGKINRGRSLDPFSWVRTEIERWRTQEDQQAKEEAGSAGDVEAETAYAEMGDAEMALLDPDAEEPALELEQEKSLPEVRERDVTWIEAQEDLRESEETITPDETVPAETPDETSTKTPDEPEDAAESDDPLDLDGPPDLGTLEDLIELTGAAESSELPETPAEASFDDADTADAADTDEQEQHIYGADENDADIPDTSEYSQQTGIFYDNLQSLYGLLQNLEQPVAFPEVMLPEEEISETEASEMPEELQETGEVETEAAVADKADSEEALDAAKALDDLMDADLGGTDAFQWIAKPKTGYNIGKSGKEYTVSELETLIKE